MNMKKILSAALAFTIGATATFGLSSCIELESSNGADSSADSQATHSHAFGEWTRHSIAADCEDAVFQRVCAKCGQTESRQGTENDHVWTAKSEYTAAYHQLACELCEKEQAQEQHIDQGNGICKGCKLFIPTEYVTYEISSDGTYAIATGYDEEETNVVAISPIYEGLPVKAIANSAFEGCTDLATVHLPESITTLGDAAFNGCQSLQGIFLGKNITSVGDNAFGGCAALMVFCEAEEQPESWSESWNPLDKTTLWGQTKHNATPVSVKALKIADAMLYQSDKGGHQIVVNPDPDGVKPPEGFSSLIRFDAAIENTASPWTDGVLWHRNFNQMDLKAYQEVWFAAKLKNSYWAFVNGPNGFVSPWVYIHMTQTGTDELGYRLWDIEVSVGTQVCYSIKSQNGRKVDEDRPINSIARLLWDEGFGSPDGNAVLIYPIKNGSPATIYCTEVLGIEMPE